MGSNEVLHQTGNTNIYFRMYHILRLPSRDIHTGWLQKKVRESGGIFSLTSKPSNPMSLKSWSTMFCQWDCMPYIICVISIYYLVNNLLITCQKIVLLLIVSPVTHRPKDDSRHSYALSNAQRSVHVVASHVVPRGGNERTLFWIFFWKFRKGFVRFSGSPLVHSNIVCSGDTVHRKRWLDKILL